ncbi:MAG: AAA family ATPase, partial [Planctomycetota bacterium]
EVFDGDGGNGHKPYCNGLIEDWTVWRYQDVERFKALVAAMAALSPDLSERLEPGNESVRVTLDDVRKIPTLRFPWGEVPITLLSAGMRRILSLAYVLVWTWHEHLQAVKLTGHPVAERMIVLIDEVESHLHPRWQRRILPAVVNTISGLADQLDVQVICSSHSPMVLASMEPTFDPARDRLFHLDASGNGTGASVRQVPFAKFGDAVGWLTSPVFGLEQARSAEAEEAIEAAEAFMRNDLAALPDGLRTKDEIHAELQRVLGELDEFWLRWVVTAPPVRKP